MMKHTAIVIGGGRPKDERFKWTDTGLANIKGAIKPHRSIAATRNGAEAPG